MSKFVYSAIGFILIFGFSVVTIGLGFRDYEMYKKERTETYTTAMNYHIAHCKDLHDVAKYGMNADCAIRKKVIDQDPKLHAFYDVLEGWRLCSGDRCDRILDGFAWNIWKIFLPAILLWVVVLFLCGSRVRQFYGEQNANLYGPFGGYSTNPNGIATPISLKKQQ